MKRIFIPINPVPASRPRVYNTGGVGYSKNYTKWKREAAKATKHLIQETPTYGKEAPLCVIITHHAQKPKSSKLFAPRYDVDNATKAVLDLVNDLGIWHDDVQIVTEVTHKRWVTSNDKVGTEIVILPLPIGKLPFVTKIIYRVQTMISKFVEDLFQVSPWEDN